MKTKKPLTKEQRIKKLEAEIKELRRSLQGVTNKLNDLLADQLMHDKFGPIKMKKEPYRPF